MSTDVPSPQELRAQGQALDDQQKKILTAMIAHMIEQAHRVKEREWISEMFAHTIAIAFADHEREDGGATSPQATSEDVDRVQAYAKEHASTILPLAYGIFGQVALTLQERGGPITAEAAMAEVLSYVQ